MRAIYILGLREAPKLVSTSAIAHELGVSQPSVTSMVKRLASLRLVRHVPYRGVRLTALGERRAKELTRHHRLLELFLVEQLGFSVETVHEEADRLEHALSETVEESIAVALGNPTSDPHGDPIPS